MNIVLYCPKAGGQQSKRFHSLRKAKDFIPEACRRDCGGFAYLVVGRHNVVKLLQQWRYGKVSYCASGKLASKQSGF